MTKVTLFSILLSIMVAGCSHLAVEDSASVPSDDAAIVDTPETGVVRDDRENETVSDRDEMVPTLCPDQVVAATQELPEGSRCSERWLAYAENQHQSGQLPLALEAYLEACSARPALSESDLGRAKAAAKELRDFRSVESDQLLKAESIQRLFFDPEFETRIDTLEERCGFPVSVTKAFGASSSGRAYINFRNLNFPVGSGELPPKGIEQAGEIAKAIVSHLNETGAGLSVDAIIIEGHADSQPFAGVDREESRQLNHELSKKRALKVESKLVALGVEEELLEIEAYGEDRPMMAENTPEAHAKNRRVTVRIRMN